MPDYYGDNLLENPGAEDGADHWSGSPSAVSGGTEGTQCFEIAEGASIYQNVVPGEGSFSGSIQVSATYLPEYLPERETNRESWRKIQVQLTHVGGTYSTHTCPCEIAEESG